MRLGYHQQWYKTILDTRMRYKNTGEPARVNHTACFGNTTCLTENTLIKTPKGNQTLKKLSKTKTFPIYSYNFKSKKMNKVEEDFARIINTGKQEVYEIETLSRKKVQATLEHTFFVKRNKKIKEVKLKDLKQEDYIMVVINLNPTVSLWRQIRSIKKIGIRQTYDLQVQKNHNIILSNGILTHNSGKNYLLQNTFEYMVKKKAIKLFCLHCNKMERLEEILTFMYPNVHSAKQLKKIRKQQRKPTAFKVNVYVPISEDAPDKMPENFIPFTIDCADLDEKTLQVLYGSTDATRLKQLYDTEVAKKNVGFAEMKHSLSKIGRITKTTTVKGFMGANTISYATLQEKVVMAFLNRLQVFNKLGVFGSPSFEYEYKKDKCPANLKDLLREELKDQQTIVALYTGYLKNEQAKILTMAYFIKCLDDLMGDTGEGMQWKLPYKVHIFLDEVRKLFPKSTDAAFKELNKGLLEISSFLVTEGRHSNIESSFITQSPTHLDESILNQIQTTYITQLKHKKDLEWLSEYYKSSSKQDIQTIMRLFDILRKRGEYRFLIADQDIPQTNTLADVGYTLPTPRLSWYPTGKVPIAREGFEMLETDPNSGINLGIKTITRMKHAKISLLKEIRRREEKVLNKIIKKEQQIEKEKQIKTEQKMEKDFEELMKVVETYNKGETAIATIQTVTGITRDKIRGYIGKARLKGFLKKPEPKTMPRKPIPTPTPEELEAKKEAIIATSR